MLEYLLNPKYDNIEQVLFQSIILIALAAVVFYIIYFLLTKVIYKKSFLFRDKSLKLTFLWAFVVLVILLDIYFYYLLRSYGYDNFKWNYLGTYFSLLPQIIVYLVLITFFVFNYRKFKKNI
jgi:hypothetical protein